MRRRRNRPATRVGDDMQKSSDPTSLDNLHDIVVPAPAPWWPPASGWYLLIALSVTVAVWWSIRWLLQRRANRYRREALSILHGLRSQSDSENPASALLELDLLLKRVALAAWPRETVASLSGRDWIDFLRSTGRSSGEQTGIDQKNPWALVHDVVYSETVRQKLTPNDVERVFEIAEQWIETHQRPESLTASTTPETATSQSNITSAAGDVG